MKLRIIGYIVVFHSWFCALVSAGVSADGDARAWGNPRLSDRSTVVADRVHLLRLVSGETLADYRARSFWNVEKSRDWRSDSTGSIGRWRLPTCGGLQFWTDVRLHDGWRIQRHALSESYRLLDPRMRLRDFGGLNQCAASAVSLCHPTRSGNRDQFPPRRGVLVLHGIAQSRYHANGLVRALRQAGYDAQGMSYASTRSSIARHADDLAQLLSHWHPEQKVALVGFSMGGLVIRDYLARHGDERVDRVIFIGTPHHGAVLADYLADVPAYRVLFGAAGQQLRTDPVGIHQRLPDDPGVPYGVIVGGTGKGGFSPLLVGDDDGIVSVDEATLAGSADWIRVAAPHALLLAMPRTHRQVVHFLEHGRFETTAERNRDWFGWQRMPTVAPTPGAESPAELSASGSSPR